MVKMNLKIDGMMCGMCEAHINDVIRRNFEVKKVTSSHKKGSCEVLAPDAIPEEALKKAIDETGYTLTGYAVSPYEKKGLFGFRK